MSPGPTPGGDALRELRYALAETESPSDALRARVLESALTRRAPGRAVPEPQRISGVEVFRRTTEALDALLDDLGPGEWLQPALRDLDVQGLVGHLIGVEDDFLALLEERRPDPGPGQHVAATDPAARAQVGRPGRATHLDWADLVSRTLHRLGQQADPNAPITWYGITLPLDLLLVVRGFELWIHDGDVRRATGRPPADPDPETLARMTDLATSLLPNGMALAERARPGRAVRLVLTGPGGGTWDVLLEPDQDHDAPRPPSTARIVVDAAAFCRVVGNRSDQEGAGGLVSGDALLARDVFAGAAALALD